MDRETLVQLYNTLNEIEVKGYENVNRLFGVLFTMRQVLEQPVQKPMQQPQEQSIDQE